MYRKDSGLLKFKVMMLGDAGVGKTSIARRFTDENFMQTYIHTIGIDFLEKTIQCKPESEDEDPVDVKLQIWDTAGQERYYSRRYPECIPFEWAKSTVSSEKRWNFELLLDLKLYILAK